MMKFVRVFTGRDGEEASLQNQANQWVFENGLTNVEYRYQLTASEFEGYPFLIHSIMVIYEADQPIPVQEKAPETEEQELVPVVEEDDFPF
jgi:hypothetical protein